MSTRELLRFIEWKLGKDSEYFKEVWPEISVMGELELTRWAIRNDIIDA